MNDTLKHLNLKSQEIFQKHLLGMQHQFAIHKQNLKKSKDILNRTNSYYENIFLDVTKDHWLTDHCPNGKVPILPFMSMLDIMASFAAKYFPNKKLTIMEDVRSLTWVAIERSITIQVEINLKNMRSAHIVLYKTQGKKIKPVASCTAFFEEKYPKSQTQLSNLENPRLGINPYSELFHGPTFRRLLKVVYGDNGYSAVIETELNSKNFGFINHISLDAALHGVTPTQIYHWDAEKRANLIPFPVLVPSINFFSPPPRSTTFRSECRLDGYHIVKEYPKIFVSLFEEANIWCEFQLVSYLIHEKSLLSFFP